MTKEKMTLKIMITPTHSPCETCSLDCSLQEKQDGVCEKLNEFNNKIIAKEYDYDKAIEVMAKAIRSWEFPYSPRQIGWEDLSEDTKDDYKNMAVAALKALLER